MGKRQEREGKDEGEGEGAQGRGREGGGGGGVVEERRETGKSLTLSNQHLAVGW
jgi:hypothetical protein